MSRILSRYYIFFAWLISLASLLITQYGEIILKLPVCPLCWYQRVCLYPLALILAIASYRGDLKIAVYTAPLALIGAIIALLQYIEQMVPGFSPINLCHAGNIDCSDIHFQLFGFITYPFLSMIASLLIFISLTLSYASGKRL